MDIGKTLVIIGLTAFIICMIVLGIDNRKKKQILAKQKKEERPRIRQSVEKREQEVKRKLMKECREKYGEPTAELKLRQDFSFFKGYIHEKSEVIVILNPYNEIDIIPFNAIMDFEGVREKHSRGATTMSSTTKTSTGSLVGRSVAGGLLFGPLGAGVGAMTANRETETVVRTPDTYYTYAISLTLDSLSTPKHTLTFGPEKEWFEKAVGIISVLMKRKEEGKYNHSSNAQLLLSNHKTRTLGDRDVLFEEVARLIVSTNSASTSSLLRRYSIGYNRADKIMDELEAAGIVGPVCRGKPRDVLVDEVELEEILINLETNIK